MKNATETHPPSRREAMLRALKAAVTAAVATPLIVQVASAAPAPAAPVPEFVPENDYPFFGGEVPDGY